MKYRYMMIRIVSIEPAKTRYSIHVDRKIDERVEINKLKMFSIVLKIMNEIKTTSVMCEN